MRLMITARQALAKLVEDSSAGRLDALFARHGVELMTAFGSATRDEGAAGDLDLAVSLTPESDLYALVSDLVGYLSCDGIDVVDLRTAGVVLKAEALGVCVPIFESRPGLYARRQMAALTERMETAHLRRLDLELMSS